MPLGSGALAGLNWDLDREATADRARLRARRRRTRSTRSPTATSRSTTSTRPPSARPTSRGSAAEIVIWSSQEFGFCEPADDFSSGSSLMPQKKNPDAAELLRAKSPRVAGSLTTLVGVLHALPLAYSKDLQEDKEALFDAVDTIELCLEAAERLLAGLQLRPRAARRRGRRRDGRGHRRRRPAGAQGDAVPRGARRGRRAGPHGARERAGALGARARRSSPSTPSCSTTSTTRSCARARGWSSKLSAGGTSAARLAEQLEAARATLDHDPPRDRLERARRGVLRPLGARGRPRSDRLRAAASTAPAG